MSHGFHAPAVDGADGERDMVQARDRLAHVERLVTMGTLVSGVAHEVRTPLAYVATNLHLLQGELEALAERNASAAEALHAARPLLDDALQGVDRINRLVLELRRYARGAPGETTVASLDGPVRRAVEVFAATRRRPADVVTRLAPTRPVRMDDAKVQQVVLNLLENAVEAAPHAPVLVETLDAEEGPRLVVRDEGPGIPEAIRDHVFEAFFTTKPSGTGLGLAIVRRITEEHRARVEVDTGPGRGTTFRVTFPAAQ